VHMMQIGQHDPTIAQLTTLTEAFTQMVRQRTPRELQSWIETVLRSGLPDLKRFATGLQHDAAVRTAFELPYSNGQTEGQVTRLKLLKRQMYGRAKFRPPPTACPPRRLSRHGTSRSLSENEAAWGLATLLYTTKIYNVV
jgi:hypothetical protein